MDEQQNPLITAGGGQSEENSCKLLDEKQSAKCETGGADLESRKTACKSTSDQKPISEPIGHTKEAMGGNSSSILPESDVAAVPALKLGKNGEDQRETATYIHDLSIGMRDIASDSGLTFLAYLLDMAAEQARSNAGFPGGVSEIVRKGGVHQD